MTLGAKRNKKKFEDLPRHLQRIGLRSMALFALVGWAVLIGYGIYAWDDARFMKESVEGVAEVIHVEERRSYDSDTGTSITYSPTFRFVTEEGEAHTVTPWYQSSDWGFAEGEEITIRYRPSEPDKALPYGYAVQWLGVPVVAWFVFGIATPFALLGTLGVWDAYRKIRFRRESDDDI